METTMPKTLLLCFIHGFKGNEETFYGFPEHFKELITEAEPDLKVETAIYPKYETRGDLPYAVLRFREWLQDHVVALEKQNGNENPLKDPSVEVVFVAHSMGGFVASDALLSILDDEQTALFPMIKGILCFDTPYNGLARSLFAYGAFSQYQNISNIWNLMAAVSSQFYIGKALTSSTTKSLAKNAPGGNQMTWKRWQTVAMRTGTYGAIAAGGVAAYTHRKEIAQGLSSINKESVTTGLSYLSKDSIAKGLSTINADNLSQAQSYVSREAIGQGFAWISSHLKFVGALMKQQELRTRLERLSAIEGVGIANLYTTLGENSYWTGGYFVPERTFCAIPTTDEKAVKLFHKEVNSKAENEVEAHLQIFRSELNPGFDKLCEDSKEKVVSWVKNRSREVKDPLKPPIEEIKKKKEEAEKVANGEIEGVPDKEEGLTPEEAAAAEEESPDEAIVPGLVYEEEKQANIEKQLDNKGRFSFTIPSIPNIPGAGKMPPLAEYLGLKKRPDDGSGDQSVPKVLEEKMQGAASTVHAEGDKQPSAENPAGEVKAPEGSAEGAHTDTAQKPGGRFGFAMPSYVAMPSMPNTAPVTQYLGLSKKSEGEAAASGEKAPSTEVLEDKMGTAATKVHEQGDAKPSVEDPAGEVKQPDAAKGRFGFSMPSIADKMPSVPGSVSGLGSYVGFKKNVGASDAPTEPTNTMAEAVKPEEEGS